MITRTRNCLLITEKNSRMFYNRSRMWREIVNPTLPLIFCAYLFNIISLLFHFFSLIQSVRIHAILRYQQLTCTCSLLLLSIMVNGWALLYAMGLSRIDVDTKMLNKGLIDWC
jgi:hypothetical protein